MSLSREQIVEAAYATLREHGLAGVSMRRLAQDLGVQPGALYYHVPSKQDLLVAVAERTLAGTELPADPAEAAEGLRRTLLAVRDSADVVSFARAFRPDALAVLAEVEGLLAARFPSVDARWGAQTLVHYLLGFVAEEQNQAELRRAGIATPDREADPAAAFAFGVEVILAGLRARAARG